MDGPSNRNYLSEGVSSERASAPPWQALGNPVASRGEPAKFRHRAGVDGTDWNMVRTRSACQPTYCDGGRPHSPTLCRIPLAGGQFRRIGRTGPIGGANRHSFVRLRIVLRFLNWPVPIFARSGSEGPDPVSTDRIVCSPTQLPVGTRSHSRCQDAQPLALGLRGGGKHAGG